MMKFSGLFRIFPLHGAVTRRSAHLHTAKIRDAMLSLLQAQTEVSVQRVVQRVRFAEDLEALWYLRQDVLATLSAINGEMIARRQMEAINRQFRGRLPVTMVPRIHQRFSSRPVP